jgi:putative aldouronate transport system substrate-binding protein
MYAIINTQVEGRTPGIIILKKYADEYNLDLANIHSLADLTPFFEKVHAGNPSLTTFEFNQGNTLNDIMISKGIELFSQTNPAAVYINDSTDTVMNYFATPEFADVCNLMHTWYQDGIIVKAAETISDDSANEKAGNVVSYSTVINPDTAANQAVTFGQTSAAGVVTATFSNTYMDTSSIIATMTAISRTSQNPDRCLMLYNLMYDKNDTKLFNMLSYGIEGTNYNLANGVVAPIANSGYSLASGWEYGDMFNSYKQSASQPNWYPTGPNINNNATVSKILGFNFDPTNVQTQLAQCASVVGEYYLGLESGSMDPATTLPKFLSLLDKAGAPAIIAETQKQLNAWKAAQ